MIFKRGWNVPFLLPRFKCRNIYFTGKVDINESEYTMMYYPWPRNHVINTCTTDKTCQ